VPGEELGGLVGKLDARDWLGDCLALQSELRAGDHRRLRAETNDRRAALVLAERALREAREQEQDWRERAELSDDVGTANGVLAGLVAAICWWGGLLHGLACAAHIGQATYCREREAGAQRDAVRQQAARADASQRAQATISDMQTAVELEGRMRARLFAALEAERRNVETALGAGGGGHAGRAGW